MYVVFQKKMIILRFSSLFWELFFLSQNHDTMHETHYLQNIILWTVCRVQFFLFFLQFFLKKMFLFRPWNPNIKAIFYKIKITFTVLKWSVFSKKHVFFSFLNFDFDQEIVLNIILFVVFLSANFKCFWKKNISF